MIEPRKMEDVSCNLAILNMPYIYMVGTSNQSVPVAWPLMENLWCQFWRMIGKWLSRPVANAALSPLEVDPICASHALNH